MRTTPEIKPAHLVIQARFAPVVAFPVAIETASSAARPACRLRNIKAGLSLVACFKIAISGGVKPVRRAVMNRGGTHSPRRALALSAHAAAVPKKGRA